jgi:hypothetical protein
VNNLQQALELAARGFHVFPLEPNGKLPVIKDYPNKATRDPETIKRWFENAHRNIGISTTKFGEDQALVVVDVDNKGEKRGDEQLLALEMEGHELPASFEQSTPTGGRHIIYVTDTACNQGGANVLGNGLDVRSRGGYIVAPGSQIDGKKYSQINGHSTLVPAPDWLVHRLGSSRERVAAEPIALGNIDPDRAIVRAMEYLKTAPVAVEGNGGDSVTFKVAARLKDLGCTLPQAFTLMVDWNDRCEPPWETAELSEKVQHAYQYGREPAGVAAPEAVFDVVKRDEDEGEEPEHPVRALNKEYAFIKAGAYVLQETTDQKGKFTTIRMSPNDMHSWFTNDMIDGKPKSKEWMKLRDRRQYDNVVFAPQQQIDPRFYNLWRGFSVPPAATPNHPAVDQFLDHALNNVCAGDKKLCDWLIGYFAHMIQRPYEKPLVALVFKGQKGTGKNALVERVGALLGPHFMVADDERYLLGNFNSHLESNLFFVLDEAAWAGDKRAEGKLKGLITGSQHNIERKGIDHYTVDNLTRVAIIGNEKWLVPATQDERRFAVFNVGEGRKQDREFFHSMRVGLEQGGYANLLRFLLDYDISALDINEAPATQGLIDQKHASLEPVQEWWLDCLETGELLGGDFSGVIPERIVTDHAYNAFGKWTKQRNIRSRLPSHKNFVEDMRHFMDKKRARVDGKPEYAFINPDIEHLRARWDAFIGGAHTWTNLTTGEST